TEAAISPPRPFRLRRKCPPPGIIHPSATAGSHFAVDTCVVCSATLLFYLTPFVEPVAPCEGLQKFLLSPFELARFFGVRDQHLHAGLYQFARRQELFVELIHPGHGAVELLLRTFFKCSGALLACRNDPIRFLPAPFRALFRLLPAPFRVLPSFFRI